MHQMQSIYCHHSFKKLIKWHSSFFKFTRHLHNGLNAPLYLGKIKRSYKRVKVEEHSDQWAVKLDDRDLFSPGGRKLLMPTKACASLIASELDSQNGTLQLEKMPYSSLMVQAVDIIEQDRRGIESGILKYLQTDTTVFQSKRNEECESVVNTVHDAIKNKFCLKRDIAISSTLIAPKQYESDYNVLANIVRVQSNWELSSLYTVTRNLNSCLVGIAYIYDLVSAETAYKAAFFEERLQQLKWGTLDDHRINEEVVIMWLHAAKLFSSATRDYQTIEQRRF